jgi:DNA-binding transcriptional MerR regulator
MKNGYKIGEFALNLGVSSGFLKHHENHGLLAPRVSDSGYRYYEMGQASLVIQCLALQNIGFSGKEISEIMNHSSSIDITERIQEKTDEIRKKMVFYEEMLRQLEHDYAPFRAQERMTQRPDGSAMPQTHESWSIGEAEPFYCMENARNGRFYGTERHSEIAQDWNHYMPVTQIFSRVEFSGDLPDAESISAWNMGLKIDAAAADRFGIATNETMRLIRPGRCLIYHFSGLRKREHGGPALAEMLRTPISICRKHNFRIRQEIYLFNIFGSTTEPENYVRETALFPLAE